MPGDAAIAMPVLDAHVLAGAACRPPTLQLPWAMSLPWATASDADSAKMLEEPAEGPAR